MPGSEHPIDVVITWVDGGDPRHIAKRESVAAAPDSIRETVSGKARFSDNGEIYFALASTLKYARYVQNIWIVTDDQSPKYLSEFQQLAGRYGQSINIVDHKVIFRGFEEALPSFNSLSIESMLWRIPDLAENFIYLNDDVFFASETCPQTLFPNGMPALNGHWRRSWLHFLFPLRAAISSARGKGRLAPGFRRSQENGAKEAGYHGRYFQFDHHPHPLRRSTLEAYANQNAGNLERQISHHFRDARQFSPVALANHLEIRAGARPQQSAQRLAYFTDRNSAEADEQLTALKRGEMDFGCIQSMDEMDEEVRRKITNALLELFGDELPQAVKRDLRSG